MRRKKILVFSLIIAMILTLLPVLPDYRGTVMAAQEESLLSEESLLPEEETEETPGEEGLLTEEVVLDQAGEPEIFLLEEGTVEIGSEEELIAFANRVNAGERELNAVLTADIVLTAAWNPIKPNSGSIGDAYTGTFDGAGHKISGLSISSTSAGQGFFGQIDGAVIKNLAVEGTVSTSKGYVGGIVGQVRTGTIENCSFSGTVSTTSTTSSGHVGGIAGYMSTAQSSSISGCVNYADVTGGVAGGIAGYAKYCTITDCYNTGTITGKSRSGGIAGQAQNNVAVSNCYNIGANEGASSTKADIADFLYTSASLTNCYFLTSASGAGAGTVTECGKIDKATLASSLGSAFTEDVNGINDGYAILSWQAGGTVVPKDPKIVITGNSALNCENNDTQPTGTLTVNFVDMDSLPVTWELTEGNDVLALSDPTEPDIYNAVKVITGLKPGTAKVTVKTADGEYTAELAVSVYPFITGITLNSPVVAGSSYQADVSVYGGGTYDYENYPVLNSFTWRYFDSRSDYTANPSGGTVLPGTGYQIDIPEELEGKWLTVTLRYQGSDITPYSPYGADIKAKTVPVTAVSVEGTTEDGSGLATKSGTLLTAAALGSDGKEPTNVSYQWEKYEEEWDDYWEEWDYTWKAMDGQTSRTFQVPDDKSAVNAQYRVVVKGDENSKVTSKTIKVTELSDHLKALEDADAVTVTGADKITETGKLELAGTGANGSVITWKSSDESFIGTDGTVLKLPEEGTLEVVLTATAAIGEETAAKDIKCTLYSAQAAADDALLAQALEKYAYGTLTPVFGTDTNIARFLEADLAKKGFEDITTEVTGVSARGGQTNGSVDIAEDGTITWFYDDPMSLGGWGKRTYGQFDVDFVLTKGAARATLSKVVNVYWDVDKLCAALKEQVLDQLTFDEIKGDNDTIDNVKTDLVLPQYLGGKDGGKTLAKITWKSTDANVISVKESTGSIDDQIYGPYTGVVQQAATDQTVRLIATISYSKTNSGAAVEEDGISELYKAFTITVPALDAEVILSDMQAKLDAGITPDKLTYSTDGTKADPEAVTGDLQLVIPKNTGIEGYSDYKFTYLSENPDAISVNGYRANVFRPLPGEEDAAAQITVTMTRKDNENLSVSKTLPVTVKALTQEELDEASRLMNRVAAAYWDGIKGENTDKNNITQDLRAFQEMNLDADGNVVFVYNSSELTGTGVAPVTYVENPDGSSDDAYTKFHSSKPHVIQSGFPRLLDKPEYDTIVTLESFLSHEVYGNYYIKFRDTDPEKAKLFESFYRQRAAATVVVKGEKGADPDPDAQINVTFQIQGANGESWLDAVSVTADKESVLGDVLEKVFSDNGFTFTGNMDYIRSITEPGGKSLEEMDLGENSGWMYRVNKVLPGKKLSEYILKDQDEVLLFFTQDYTKEPEVLVETVDISGADVSGLKKMTYSGKNLEPKPVVKVDGNTLEEGTDYTLSYKNNVKPGKASVTITGIGKYTGSVTQTFEIADLVLKKLAIKLVPELATKTTYQLELVYDPANTTQTGVVWTSSNKDIATVDAAGKLTVHKYGTTTITAKSSVNGKITASRKVQTRFYDALSTNVDKEMFKAIYWAVDNDISGMPVYFKTKDSMTRGQFVHFLWNLAGKPKVNIKKITNPFADVNKKTAHYKQILWAVDKGLIAGYKEKGKQVFKPEGTLTRQNVATILWKYAGSPKVSKVKKPFADVAKSAAVAWGKSKGIFKADKNGKFKPKADCIRGDFAVFLYRYNNKYKVIK